MGNPNAYGTTPEERFWAKVDRSGGPDACWPWTGATQAKGYGRVTVDQRNDGSHRVALSLKLGRPLGSGELACHTCDNPPCCNPRHLFAGSSVDNDRDKIAKGRSNRGERHGHAVLTDETVLAIRRRHAESCATHQAIAGEFGLPRRLVSRVISRERWTHL